MDEVTQALQVSRNRLRDLLPGFSGFIDRLRLVIRMSVLLLGGLYLRGDVDFGMGGSRDAVSFDAGASLIPTPTRSPNPFGCGVQTLAIKSPDTTGSAQRRSEQAG